VATALTGPDRRDTVCRQMATKVNWSVLLTLRFIGLILMQAPSSNLLTASRLVGS